MVTLFEPMKINIQLRKLITDSQLAQLMDIEMVSAKELLDGIIPFEHNELDEVSKYLGIDINKLANAI